MPPGAQIFWIYLLEGLLLGTLGLGLGPPLGLLLARPIGAASGFLSFGGGLPIRLAPTAQGYASALIAAALCLLVGLVPALQLAGRSLLQLKGEQARQGRGPLWQRFFLDLVALAVALYGLFILNRQGPVTSGAGTAAIADDPLIGLAPLLFTVAVTMMIIRVLPWMARAGLLLLARLASPPLHVALQSIARAPRQPMRLVGLCTLTLTLGVFAATVAGIERQNLADRELYAAGAQLRLEELLGQPQVSRGQETDTLPLAEHLQLPGVQAATQALRFETSGNITNATSNGTNVNLLGVDPRTAQGVMWFRPDFADLSFGQLLAIIARPEPAAIVSDSFLAATGLHQGDPFSVGLANGRTLQARVAASAHYFPSLDPRQLPFVVTNLDYLRAQSGNPGPNEVWLRTPANQAIVDRLVALTENWPRQVVAHQGVTPAFSARDTPLTAGIYGVVSVGFLIAIVLSLLGFFAYAYLSLQRRLTEFAILRALGLSAGQLRRLLLFEQFFLLGAGIAGGIFAGVLTTRLFLPYLPIATNTVPPFLITMPWLTVGEFVLVVLAVFAAVLSAHSTMLLKLQLGRVLRLGEG